VPIRLGSRTFSPRWFTTALTLLLLAMLLSLGRWQLNRAAQKRALFDAFAAGSDQTLPVEAAVNRYQHVEAHGRYDPEHQVLIDNMISASGRAGYYVVTPFELDGGQWLLVNRGWIPVGDRARLPAIPVAASPRQIRGRIDRLPQPGIHMGQAQPLPIRASFPARADVEAALGGRRWLGNVEVVLLDGDQPDGYLREWAAPGFPPLRHIAYAVQWFGLALALFVIYIVTNLKTMDRVQS
jgi:surfeit locus 1 family protein